MSQKEEVQEYFFRVTGEKFSNLDRRLDKIDKKLEMLIGFRMMLIGAAAVVSAAVSTGLLILFGK